MLPHIVRYTDSMPSNLGGMAQAFYVRIRPKYKDDIGIHDHEYTHVKQWYLLLFLWSAIVLSVVFLLGLPVDYLGVIVAGVGIHGLLYMTSKTYRTYSEAQAYAAQVKPDMSDLDLMAYRMATGYNLDITQSDAKSKISSYL